MRRDKRSTARVRRPPARRATRRVYDLQSLDLSFEGTLQKIRVARRRWPRRCGRVTRGPALHPCVATARQTIRLRSCYSEGYTLPGSVDCWDFEWDPRLRSAGRRLQDTRAYRDRMRAAGGRPGT